MVFHAHPTRIPNAGWNVPGCRPGVRASFLFPMFSWQHPAAPGRRLIVIVLVMGWVCVWAVVGLCSALLGDVLAR